ncbi:hypothetical protein U9M48_010625, partial [Paspalum notatum var. saurae]
VIPREHIQHRELLLAVHPAEQFATRMGAKVEGESYMPGYYATGDLNMEANGRWSPYYEETTSNGQLCNGFTTKPTNGYSEFDKEMVKHQMLEHEAVFRQQPHSPLTFQVYELHRVYQIQRDMMKQHHSKEVYSYPMLAVASHTNSPSQVPSNGTKMMWQMPVPRKAPVAENNDTNQSSMKFLREGSVQSSPNGFLSCDAAPRVRQGAFDLHLPADHYIDDDNTSENKPIDFLGLASDAKAHNDADLTLVSADGFGRFSDNSSTSGKQVSGITFLAPRYSDADAPKYLKAADGRPANCNQYVYQGQNSSVGWFARSPLEPSAINNFARLDRSHHSNVGTFTAPISIPPIDHASIVSPMGSCTADPRSSVINNPALIPRFNGSSAVNSYTSLSAVTQSIGTSTPKLKHVDNLDGRYPGFPFDSFSASHSRHQAAISSNLDPKNSQKNEHSDRQSNGKGMKNFNLNETLLDCQEDGLVEQDGTCAGSFQHSKDGGSVFGISWLKNKTMCTDLTSLEKPGKIFGHSFGTAMELKNTKDLNEPALTIRNLSDSASTSLGCGIKNDGRPSGDIIGSTLLVCNKAQESAACLPLPFQKHVPKDGQGAEGVIQKSCGPIRNFIDLNDDVPNEDNSEESVVSHECQVAPLPNSQPKRAFVIDLEMPAEEADAWAFDQECARPVKLDPCQEVDDRSVFATAAAENIVALSMDRPTAADAPDDLLQWFADFAVSNINDLAEQVELQACNNDSSDDELDSFESLTLKLEETKIDEYWSRPLEPAITTDEQTGSTAHLLTKPRRGQQRRRRQKRDFQKDILPGLSTLSRPEIFEDVQLLEGLVQASGGSWESSLTRKGRYGGRTRGRKPRKTVVTVTVEEEEVDVSPPPKPAGTGDLEADDRGMIGWGRTTRRCRRTRCPSGSNIAAAS